MTSEDPAPPYPSGSPWSLRRRLVAAVLTLGIVLVALVTAAVALLVQLRDEQHTVIDRYFRAVRTSTVRFTDQVDAESAIRGYALTADPATLAPLSEYRSPSYAGQVPLLNSLVRHDPKAAAALGGWDTAVQGWYEEWALPTIAEVRANGRDAVSTQQVLHGKMLFDANRRAFGAYSTVLVARRDAASHALRLRTNLLFGAVVFVALSVILASTALWWGLRRWVVDPLASVGNETRLVREGDLSHRLQVTGPREVQALAADVDGMRRDLVDQLAEVERSRQGIETAQLQLEAQAAELSRSNRDLEQFAYVASHDLQEPLRKVASFCQLLERRYSGQLDERGEQYIEFAVDGAKRMQQLINDLLIFSRVGRTGESAEVDLNDCLQTASRNLAAAIESSGAQVTSDRLPTVRGQAGPLTQLLQNLVGNAVKFRGEANPRIHVGAVRRGDFWEFDCSDNGLGIEPQYAERIFVIFQRLHPKETYPGTGIGLALCKRIVEQHGGRIWLDNTNPAVPGDGTTFRWTLPAAGADSPTPPSQEAR